MQDPSIGRDAPTDAPVRALARLGDFDALPATALVPAADVRVLLGGISDFTLARLVERGALPPPMRFVSCGASPRLWSVGEVRAFLAGLAAKREVV